MYALMHVYIRVFWTFEVETHIYIASQPYLYV